MCAVSVSVTKALITRVNISYVALHNNCSLAPSRLAGSTVFFQHFPHITSSGAVTADKKYVNLYAAYSVRSVNRLLEHRGPNSNETTEGTFKQCQRV